MRHAYEKQHLMSLADLAKHFRLEKLSRAPARFDENQLLHWQKEAILSADKATIHSWLQEKIGEMDSLPERDLSR